MIQFPNTPSLLFLGYLLVLLPLAAKRSAAAINRVEATSAAPSREVIWRSACIQLVFLFVLAWFAGSSFGFEIFAIGAIGVREIGLASGAFLLILALRSLLRMTRTPEEQRNLGIYRRAPRTNRELAWFSLASILAGVAEEAAYRGVGWSILTYSLGNAWLAAAILSIAFALAHWSQGRKSGIAILCIALIFHGLVALTHTLVLALVVHATYDLIAGHAIRRQALEYDRRSIVV